MATDESEKPIDPALLPPLAAAPNMMMEADDVENTEFAYSDRAADDWVSSGPLGDLGFGRDAPLRLGTPPRNGPESFTGGDTRGASQRSPAVMDDGPSLFAGLAEPYPSEIDGYPIDWSYFKMNEAITEAKYKVWFSDNNNHLVVGDPAGYDTWTEADDWACSRAVYGLARNRYEIRQGNVVMTCPVRNTTFSTKPACGPIYLIGSLRNPKVLEVAAALRAAGHEVFDDWYSAGEKADDAWQEYSNKRGWTYAEALAGYSAQHVFALDSTHIERCAVGVLVLPAGKSGHLELGVMIGSGKKGYILLDGVPERYDVMYNYAIKSGGRVCADVKELIAAL